jgi:hypothetical protein
MIVLSMTSSVRSAQAFGKYTLGGSQLLPAADVTEILARDCLAGHVRFEPANPPASYLIGIAWQLRLRAAQLRRRGPIACELRDTDFAALAKISAVDL